MCGHEERTSNDTSLRNMAQLQVERSVEHVMLHAGEAFDTEAVRRPRLTTQYLMTQLNLRRRKLNLTVMTWRNLVVTILQ